MLYYIIYIILIIIRKTKTKLDLFSEMIKHLCFTNFIIIKG
jgi:hypothetical protein